MDVQTKAGLLRIGNTVVGKSGQTAKVTDVVYMASGTVVTLDTDFGTVERRYDYEEAVVIGGEE